MNNMSLFKDKEQKYNFNKKIKGYAKKENNYNITYSLFQFAMIQQKEIEKLTKQLENRPMEVIEEVKPKCEKDILLDYQKQVEEMPTKYTKPTHMEEFHDVVDKMETYLCELEVEEENEELVDGSRLELWKLRRDRFDSQNNLISRFVFTTLGRVVMNFTIIDSVSTT